MIIFSDIHAKLSYSSYSVNACLVRSIMMLQTMVLVAWPVTSIHWRHAPYVPRHRQAQVIVGLDMQTYILGLLVKRSLILSCSITLHDTASITVCCHAEGNLSRDKCKVLRCVCTTYNNLTCHFTGLLHCLYKHTNAK